MPETRRIRAQSNRITAPIVTDTTSGVEISFGDFEYETNQKLVGDGRWELLSKMMHDPHIKRGVNQSIQPLRTATWQYEPKDDDPDAQRQADFCNAVFLQAENATFPDPEMATSTPWATQRLFEELSFLEHGFSLFFNRYRIAAGFEVVDPLWIEPHTIRKWILDEAGALWGVERWVRGPTLGGGWSTEVIEAFDQSGRQNLSLYTWEFRGERYAGEPFIRTQYGAWLRKDFVQRMSAIWAQKVGAPPPIGIYTDDLSEDEQKEFIRFLRQLRGSAPAEAYFAAKRERNSENPPVEVMYPGTETGEVDRLRKIIDGENLEMAHASGRKSQMLGETGSGSRATAAIHARQEAQWVEAVARVVIEWERKGTGNLNGIVEHVLARNFARPMVPQLIVSGINPFEIVDNIDGIVSAGAAGIVPVRAPGVRRQITEQLGLSVTDDEIEDPENYVSSSPSDPPGRNSPSPSPDDDEGNPDDEPDAAEMEAFQDLVRDLLTPVEDPPAKGGSFRGRNRLELICQLGHIEESFQVSEDDARRVLNRAWQAMGADLLQRVRSGKISPRNIEGQRRSRPRKRTEMVEALTDSLTETARRGDADYEAEVEREQAVVTDGEA